MVRGGIKPWSFNSTSNHSSLYTTAPFLDGPFVQLPQLPVDPASGRLQVRGRHRPAAARRRPILLAARQGPLLRQRGLRHQAGERTHQLHQGHAGSSLAAALEVETLV